MFRLHGRDPGTDVPSNELFLDRVHPDDRAAVAGSLSAQKLPGGQHDYDHRIVLPNGEVRLVQQRVGRMLDDSGSIIGVRGTTQDITESKRAEDELREREADLARAQEISHLGSWNWDIVANIHHWSAEHCRIFGLEPGSPQLRRFSYLGA